MDYQDYYQTLGLTRNASQPDIKKAFRKLAREHHPDKRPGDAAAERRFKDINEAHAVLSDPEKRRKYDLLGANWESYSQAGAGGSSAGAAIRSPASGAGPARRATFATSSGRPAVARAATSRTSSGRSLPLTNPARRERRAEPPGRPHVRGDPRPDGPERGPDQRPRRTAAGRCPGGRRKPPRRSASRRPSAERAGGSRSTASASR